MKKKIVVFTTLMLVLVLLTSLVFTLASCDENENEDENKNDNGQTENEDTDLENPIHTHSWSEWTVSKAASCSEEGLQERSCDCGEKETLSVSKLAHSEVIKPAVAASCTSTGLTEGKYCSVCKAVIAEQSVVPITSHTEVIDSAVAATCTTTGLTEGKHCSVCNTVLTVQGIIPVTSHTEVIDRAVAASCTNTGLTEGKHCSVCNTVLVKQLEISMTVHTYNDKYDEDCNVCGYVRNAECAHTKVQTIPGIPATCTQSGITDGKKCSKCGEILSTQTVIPVLEHTVVVDSAVAASCTSTGLTEGKHCSVCKSVLTAQNVISALPHDEVVDEAVAATYTSTGLTEGKHCSVCNTVTVKQQVIPMLKTIYHKVTFYDEHLPGYPKYEEYAEHIGVDKLPSLTRTGYTFNGWYTELEGGKKVAFIPAGSTENYVLYAQWSTIKYTITYNSAPSHTNKTEYTIEDEIILSDPEWSGMKFVEWQNSKGEKVAKIPKGATGNLELTATWTTYRNLVTPSGNTLLEKIYDKNSGRYYFIYDLGMIENVVLDQILESYNKTTASGHTMEIGKTVTVSESYAQSIAETVGHSVTNSSSWSNTFDDKTSESLNVSNEISVGIGAGIEGLINTTLETKYGINASLSKEHANTRVHGGGMEEEQSMLSDISYVHELSTGTTTETIMTIDIPGNMPNGYYTYVHAGNVRVFAIVTYDMSKEEFYLNTYSVLDNMHTMVMYYSTAADVNNACESLEFNIPVKAIKDDVASSYYIEYNANGGNGSMPISLHGNGATTALSKNSFTKAGYTFSGWEYRTANGNKIYKDGASVSDLASGGDTVTLYAVWAANTYTVTYNANGGNVSPTTQSKVYNSTYGSMPTPSRTGYTFKYWTLDSSPVYSSTVVQTAASHTLVAVWSANSYTVKYNGNGSTGGSTSSSSHVYDTSKALTANGFTKTGYTFNGWNTKADGSGVKYTNKQSVKNLVSAQGGSITLYAQWKASAYTVTYNANGGSVTPSSASVTYNTKYGTLPTPTREGYVFDGWYLNNTEITANTTVTTASNHSIVAKWVKITASHSKTFYDEERGKELLSPEDVYHDTGMNREELKAKNYTKLEITIKVSGEEDWVFASSHPKFKLYDCNGKVVVEKSGSNWSSNRTTQTFVLTVTVDALDDDGKIRIRYFSPEYSWLLRTSSISVKAVK